MSRFVIFLLSWLFVHAAAAQCPDTTNAELHPLTGQWNSYGTLGYPAQLNSCGIVATNFSSNTALKVGREELDGSCDCASVGCGWIDYVANLDFLNSLDTSYKVFNATLVFYPQSGAVLATDLVVNNNIQIPGGGSVATVDVTTYVANAVAAGNTFSFEVAEMQPGSASLLELYNPSQPDSAFWPRLTIEYLSGAEPQLAVVAADCSADVPGQATVSTTFGTAPYTFQWSTSAGQQTSQTATGLVVGAHGVTITDASGCEQNAVALVEQTQLPTLNMYGAPNYCNPPTPGTGDAVLSANSSTWLYQWDSAANGQTGSQATGLAAGTYHVTVSNAIGCEMIGVRTVALSGNTLTINNQILQPARCGNNNGQVNVTTSGVGWQQSTIQWDASADSLTTFSHSALSPGWHGYTIYHNGCIIEGGVDVPAQDSMFVTPIVYSKPQCGGAGAFVGYTVSGWSWNSFPDRIWHWPAGVIPSDSTPNNGVDSLQLGLYNVTVTSSVGCSTEFEIDVTDEQQLITNSYGMDSLVLQVYSSGVLTNYPSSTIGTHAELGSTCSFSVGGGLSLSYERRLLCGFATPTAPPGTELVAAWLSVYLKSASGYGGSPKQAYVGVYQVLAPWSLANFSIPWGAIGPTQGWISLPTGQNGQVHAYGTLDLTSMVQEVLDGGSWNGLMLQGPSAIMCETTLIDPSRIDLFLQFSPIVVIETTFAGCDSSATGTATASMPAGSGPFTYEWDALASGQTTATATGLGPGDYRVTMTDGAGCSHVGIASILTGTDATIALNTTTPTTPQSSDGAILAIVSGATAPYTYTWGHEFGNGSASTTGIGLGDYSVLVQDSLGCNLIGLASIDSNSCFLPGAIWTQNVQDTSAIVKWVPESSATGYKIQYKVAGTNSWNSEWKYTNVGHKYLTGLSPSTSYKYRIKTICNDTSSGWSIMQGFTTLASPCATPSGNQTAFLAQHQAKLVWNAVPSAVNYKIRYREVGGAWNTITVSANWQHKWITGLTPGTTYEWKIKALCQYGNVTGTPWSSLQTFTTTSQKQDIVVVEQAADVAAYELFPNPSSTRTAILARGIKDFQRHELALTDVAGRSIKRYSVLLQPGVPFEIELPVELSNGTYLLTINNGETQTVKCLVINR